MNPRKHHCLVSSIFSWVGAPGSLFFFNFFWGDSLAYPFPNGKASCRSSGLHCTSFKRSANCVYSRPVSMLAHLELGPDLFNFLKCASKRFTLSALALNHTAPLWPLVFRCGLFAKSLSMASLSGWGCNSACGVFWSGQPLGKNSLSPRLLKSCKSRPASMKGLLTCLGPPLFCSHPFCKGLLKPLLQGNGDVSFPKGISAGRC